MAFNIQEAKGSLPGRAKQVRAEGIDVRAGGQQIGRALAGLGWSIAGLGQNYYEMQAVTQLSQAKRLAVEEMNRLSLSFEGNLDPETYQKEYQKSLKTIQKSTGKILTNKKAATEFGLFLNDRQPRWEKGVAEYQKGRLEDNFLDELFDQQEIIEQTGIEGDFADNIARGISEGLITKLEGKKFLGTTRRNSQYNKGLRVSERDPENFLIKIDDPEYLPKLDTVARAQLKSAARAVIARRKRSMAENKRLAQEQTASQLLADFWDKKLTDPQIVTDAVRAGLITDTDAKYLRDEMLNPEPPKLNLQKLAEVKSAITDVGTGTKTRSQALAALYKNLDGIDPTTGKSLVAEIFAEVDKSDAEMRREGRDLMEELIRDREPMSGFFTDDERQILGTSEAIIMLDSAIEKAAKGKKPLTRRDILIKAIEIGQQIKNKIKREEADAIPPKFTPETEGHPVAPRAPDFTTKGRPIIKGALAKPDFVLDDEGEPEKVFDTEGREIGLRRKSGAIFGIGYFAIFAGKKYEYIGNGNWRPVK